MSDQYKSNRNYGVISFIFILICTVFFQNPVVTQAREALKLEDIPGLYQRILTLPGAKLHKAPDPSSAMLKTSMQPPVLTPLYVYEERRGNDGKKWLACSKKPRNGSLGWVPKKHTEIWKTQLVLELIPRDQVNRPNKVVFYKNWQVLSELMGKPNVKDLAIADIKHIQNHTHDLSRIVAAEPDIMPDSATKAHLIPVINYKSGLFHRKYKQIKGSQSIAFEVALVKLQVDNTQAKGTQKAKKHPKPVTSGNTSKLKDYKIGMVFLMDTTRSMERYIHLTRETIRSIYDNLEEKNAVNSVSFGLVGYRDYVGDRPGIEYVTKIYQPLDPNTPPETVLRNLSKIKPCKVPTEGFSEDMYAGLAVVVNQFDWRPFDGRFIILVTDASARQPGDPHSKISRSEYAQLKFNMNDKKLKVWPLHIKTSAAIQNGDFLKGQGQFGSEENPEFLTENGYQSEISSNRKSFQKGIDAFSNGITQAVTGVIEGKMVEAPETNSDKNNSIEKLVINEIFKTQLEFLGKQEGVDSPPHFHGWVSLIDLTRPAHDHEVVVGKYLLTRNQLNDLAKRTHALEELFKNMDAESFRKKMLEMSAQYSSDPNLDSTGIQLVSDTGILPAYLAELPYQSSIMNMSAEIWSGYSLDKQMNFLEELKEKISVYGLLNDDYENWIDLGEGENDLKVYPVPINFFP